MNPQETVRTLMDAVQAGDFRTARALLSSDFHFSGSVPEPLGAGPWIGLSANLKTAFPNLDYHFGVKGAAGGVVKISARLTGRHTGNLNLMALDMGMMAATGKAFSMAYEEGEVTVRDQQVTQWTVQPCEGAGLMTILSQLVSQVPSNTGRRQSALSVSRWDDARRADRQTSEKAGKSSWRN
jgi:hypothetical protein